MIIIPEYVAMLKADPSNNKLLQEVSFQATSPEKSSWEGSRDKHAAFRQEVTRQIYLDYSLSDRPLILTLLNQEILNCKFIENSNDNLCRLLFILYTFKQQEDLALLHEAKFKLGYDATLNIDVNLLFGLGNQLILALDSTLQRYLDYDEILEPETFHKQQKKHWDNDIKVNPIPHSMNAVEEEEDKQIRFFFDKGDILTFQFSDQKTGGVVVAERYETFDDAEYIVYPLNLCNPSPTQSLVVESLHIYGRKIKTINMGNPFEQSLKLSSSDSSLEKSKKTLLVSMTITHSVLIHFYTKFTVVASIPSIVYKGTHHLARIANWNELEMHMHNLVQGNYPSFETVNPKDFL